MEDFEKVIIGREVITTYRDTYRIKGVKTKADRDRLDTLLDNIGFTLDTFLEFDFIQTLYEIDRCFRFRRNDDVNTPALCDGCVGRSVVSCLDMSISDYFVSFCDLPPLDFYLKYTQSMVGLQGIAEQEQESISSGVTPKYLISPLSYLLTKRTNGTCPGYCVGFTHQIEEPRFDLCSKYQDIIDYGYYTYLAMYQFNN